MSLTLMAALLSVFPLSAQIDRSKAPEPGPAPEIEFGEVEKFTTKNGIRVILVEDHTRPIVSFGLRFVIEPFVEGDKAGESAFFGDLWSRGTANRTMEQINDEVDFLGASFATGSNYIGFTSLTKYTGQMMDILSDVLFNPTFPEDELEKIKDQALGGLQMSKSSPKAIVNNIITATVYPKDHPYGDIMTEATVANITVDDCREFYDKYIIPNSAILVITGDMNLRQAKKLCKKYLSDWEPGEIIKNEAPDVNRPEGIEVVFSPKEGAVQSTIRMMSPIDLKPGDDDVLALSVANAIYGGGDFSAKLLKNLRETKGYTYGAYSSINSDLLSGTFTAMADVNGDATDSSFYEMRKELQSMVDGDYTEENVEKFKTVYAGSFSRSLESINQLASYAYNVERFGYPDDYYATYLQRLDAVTIDDVRRVVAKYFDPDNMYWFVVGDPSVVPALAQYDSDGEVTMLDFEGNVIEKKKVPEGVTVQTVYDKYIEYLGGRELVDGINDITESAEMHMPGASVKTVVKRIPAAETFSQVQFQGETPVQEIRLADGKVTVSMMGNVIQEITDSVIVNAFARDTYPFVEVLGSEGCELSSEIESVNGRDAYKVTTSAADGLKYSYYDVETGAKVREVESMGDQTIETIYQEYAQTPYGVMYPSVMVVTMPQIGAVETVVTVEINTGLTPDTI